MIFASFRDFQLERDQPTYRASYRGAMAHLKRGEKEIGMKEKVKAKFGLVGSRSSWKSLIEAKITGNDSEICCDDF